MTAWAILAAAGEGSRLGGGPKAFVELAGAPMMAHSLVTLAKVTEIEGVAISAPPGHEPATREAAASAAPSLRVEVVAGGRSRRESVRLALVAVPADVERIVVHDAARPLAAVTLFESAFAALGSADGAVVAIPLADTLKRASGDRVSETVPRADLYRAQTPQAFRAGALRAAHERAAREGFDATDDAALLEWMGDRVVLVPGDERNVKITTPEDLALAEMLLGATRR